MGMAFNYPGASQNSQTEHIPWRGWKPSDRVCISIDFDCLARLITSKQLHIEAFSCNDEATLQAVKDLLLDCLRTR